MQRGLCVNPPEVPFINTCAIFAGPAFRFWDECKENNVDLHSKGAVWGVEAILCHLAIALYICSMCEKLR